MNFYRGERIGLSSFLFFLLIRSRKINRPFFSVGVPFQEGEGWDGKRDRSIISSIVSPRGIINTRTFRKWRKSCGPSTCKYLIKISNIRGSFTRKRYAHSRNYYMPCKRKKKRREREKKGALACSPCTVHRASCKNLKASRSYKVA